MVTVGILDPCGVSRRTDQNFAVRIEINVKSYGSRRRRRRFFCFVLEKGVFCIEVEAREARRNFKDFGMIT